MLACAEVVAFDEQWSRSAGPQMLIGSQSPGTKSSCSRDVSVVVEEFSLSL